MKSRAKPIVVQKDVAPRTVRLLPHDATAFAPYGQFVTPPGNPGERAFYSDAFAGAPSDTAAVIHVNHIAAATLPLTIDRVERHPRAAQCFVPMDVAGYAVVVMASDADGNPDPDRTLAFDVPGTVGVIYAPGVWHCGAMVFDRDGYFVVTMWRGGAVPDDEFRDMPPLILTR